MINLLIFSPAISGPFCRPVATIPIRAAFDPENESSLDGLGLGCKCVSVIFRYFLFGADAPFHRIARMHNALATIRGRFMLSLSQSQRSGRLTQKLIL